MTRRKLALLALVGLWAAISAGAETLRALVWEVDTPRTELKGLFPLLREAGFVVAPLPLDRPPNQLKADLIVLGSFANETPGYAPYMKAYAAELREFVGRGGVLLQMAQKEESQIVPAFLPATVRAARGDAQLGDVRVVQERHPLLAGVKAGADSAGRLNLPKHLGLEPGWHTFMEQSGCAVLLGAGQGSNDPVLLEIAEDRGRFLLTSLFFDRLYSPDGQLGAPTAYADFARVFLRDLAGYVQAAKDGRAAAVEVTPQPVPLPFVPGSWTIVVLPDTQYYSRSYPEVFEAQTKWIAQHVQDRNIKYVLHLGDITADNLEPQWQAAQRAMSHLDGVVPYALVGGNHDYGPKGNSANRESFLNEYFPLARYAGWPTFGGAMESGKVDNTCHLFEAGGKKWIVLALEWAPRDEVVAWADRVLTEHPDRLGILITHAYLSSDNTRYDYATRGEKQSATPHHYQLTKLPGRGNDGEELWQKLVSRHPNMVLTVNGHVLEDGVARLSSEGIHGNVVHQMLVNYQRMRPKQGNGFLRLLEFLPDGKTIQVRGYSPVWDTYKTDVQNQFLLTLAPARD
jgi:3',5'-cyclic AMP phosphodiesterase CpdA